MKQAQRIEKAPLSEMVEEIDPAWDDNYAKKNTVCICPKCSVRHKMDLFWAGRGLPRKFCPSCRGRFSD
jgi:hypothetical protein